MSRWPSGLCCGCCSCSCCYCRRSSRRRCRRCPFPASSKTASFFIASIIAISSAIADAVRIHASAFPAPKVFPIAPQSSLRHASEFISASSDAVHAPVAHFGPRHALACFRATELLFAASAILLAVILLMNMEASKLTASASVSLMTS